MTTPANIAEVAVRRQPPKRAARLHRLIASSSGYLALVGLGWIVPLCKLATGDEPRRQLTELWQELAVPLLALGLMLLVWGMLAPRIETSLGTVPTPGAVWAEARSLVAEYHAERERRDAFYARQHERNAAKLAEDPNADTKVRQYTGKPTFLDQIFTSLRTVFAGFVLATLIAVPVGVASTKPANTVRRLVKI